ncbi:hypothetical protein [Mycetocola saprophilus]|uniref:hypothetical protein n=1 Tax=Mycetocola saprophilus TaxID=76636 RepID=UPI003BF0E851
METTQARPHGSHIEYFVTARQGNLVAVTCWCSIGKNHTHDAWIQAGRPASEDPSA